MPLVVSLAFLVLAILGAILTLNACRPLARRGNAAVPVFFAGWLISELPIHHIVVQAVITAGFVWLGALATWAGWLALGINTISWIALARLVVDAQRAHAHFEQALCTDLGEDYRERTHPAWRDRDDPHLTLIRILRSFRVAHPLVERIRDLRYTPHEKRGLLDIVRHKDVPRGCPVLLQVHGGGWIVGSKEDQGIPLTNHLAALGWVCVAINYRLSPRSTFPDHIVDVKAAIAWIKEHIHEYGGDPGFIAITGGSAGGHLAALAALTPNASEYQPGFESKDTAVQACVSFYGVYDWTNRTGCGNTGLISFLEKHVVKRPYQQAAEVYDRASPMSRVAASAPSFFAIHGTHDTLVPVDEARRFVGMLREVSRTHVVYAEIPGTQHAFEVFLSFRAAHAIRAVSRYLAFVYSEHLARSVQNAVSKAPLALTSD